MSGAVILLSNYVIAKINVDPKEAGETAKKVADIIGAASSIVKSCIDAAVNLALIGVAVSTGIFGLVVRLGLAGAVGIMMMIPAIVALSISVIKLAQSVVAKLNMNPEEAGKIATNVATILSAAGSIVKSCTASSLFLAAIGVGVKTGIFAAVAAAAVPGAAGIMMMVPGMVALASSVMSISSAVMGAMGMSPEEAEKTSVAIGNIIASFAKIVIGISGISAILGVGGAAKTVSSTAKKFGAIGRVAGWVIDKGTSKIKESVSNGASMITDMIPTLTSLASAVQQLNNSIGDKINFDPKKITDFINSISDVMKKVGEIKGRIKEIESFASSDGGGGGIFSGIFNSIFGGSSKKKTGLSALGAYLTDNVITPIENDFPEINRLQQVVTKLTLLKGVLDSIAKIMDSLSSTNAKVNNYKNVDTGKLNAIMQSVGSQTNAMTMPMPMRADANISNANSNKATASTAYVGSAPNPERAIKKEKATSSSDNNLSSIDLGQIAANTQEEVDLNKKMVNLLETIAIYLKPDSRAKGSDGAGPGDTSTKYNLSSPPKYYKWSTGKHNQTAGKAVLNVGGTN